MRWLVRLVKAVAYGSLGLLVLLALWALVPAGTAPIEGGRRVAAMSVQWLVAEAAAGALGGAAA